MLKDISPGEVRERIVRGETFVVNMVASWCPDCREGQRPHLPEFAEQLEKAGISVCECRVQEEKLVFLSREHEALTNDFGGHGYPRTVLVVKGAVEDSRVEVVDPLSLGILATEWIARVRSAVF